SLSFYLVSILLIYIYFLFTDPPTTQNYTLSLHDALPILNKLYLLMEKQHNRGQDGAGIAAVKLNVEPGYPFMHRIRSNAPQAIRSEEHTSELQSRENLVCRLLLEKKKKNKNTMNKRTTEQ